MFKFCTFRHRAPGKRFKYPCAMERIRALDHCEVFHQLQSEIVQFDAKQKKLENLRYWSGNEEHIVELCRRLLGVLLEHSLVEQLPQADVDSEALLVQPAAQADANQLRGALVFLILNSNNKYNCDIEELRRLNPQCVHLIGLCPPLPQFVTVAIAYKCGLAQPFNEFLACAPHWLSRQYFDVVNQTLAHLDDSVSVSSNKKELLQHLGGVLCAAAEAIGFYALRGGPSDCSLASSNLLINSAKLLQRHVLDSPERLRVLRPLARKCYLGDATRELIQVLNYTLQLSQSSETPQFPSHFLLYLLRVPGESISAEPHQALPIYRSLAGALLNVLQNVLMNVSIDAFMLWQELPSSELLFSQQQHIGGLAKTLMQLLAADSELRGHAVAGSLKSFAAAAKTLPQLLKELSMREILSFVDGEKGALTEQQLRAGLDELFDRPLALGNDECIESMAQHLELLQFSHAQQLLLYLRDVALVKSEEEQGDQGLLILGLLRPIFVASSEQQQLELLSQRDELQLLQHFDFEAPSHEASRIHFFNNITKDKMPFAKFLLLCFDNPLETWLSLGQLAMAHPNFEQLYWRTARRCGVHAANNVNDMLEKLLRDERMLLNHNAQHFLLTLYNFHVRLNSQRILRQVIFKRCRALHKLRSCRSKPLPALRLNLNPQLLPYSQQQLKLGQERFLDAFADGLAEFVEAENYVALERLFQLLLQMAAGDKRLIICGREQLLRLRRQKPPGQKQQRTSLATAKRYASWHGQRIYWRNTHWPLTAQLIITVDKLRWNLDNFEHRRVDVLTLAVRYVTENMPHVCNMPEDFLAKIDALVSTLRHKEFWLPELKTLPNVQFDCPNVELLLQASEEEAQGLILEAMQNFNAKAIMLKVAQAVRNASSLATALNAYGFIFKCYVDVFKRVYLPAAVSDCGTLLSGLVDVIRRSPEGAHNQAMENAAPLIKKLYKSVRDSNKRQKIRCVVNRIPNNDDMIAWMAGEEAKVNN